MAIDRMWSVAEGQELSDNLRCSICTDAFHNPRRLSKCGHYFCESCISAWNETNHICPIDRTSISPTSNAISGPDRIVVQFLDELNIICTFCGFHGKKGLHQCAAFSCQFDHCTFKASDDDAVKRHTVTCRWNNSGSTSSDVSRKAARDEYESLITDDTINDMLPQKESLIAAGLALAAGVVGGLILGKVIANNKRDK